MMATEECPFFKSQNWPIRALFLTWQQHNDSYWWRWDMWHTATLPRTEVCPRSVRRTVIGRFTSSWSWRENKTNCDKWDWNVSIFGHFYQIIFKTVNIFVVTWVACDCVFCWCIRGPWELLATGLSDIYICRLQKWGQEVLEVLEVPVVCSPEPTANCLHATNPAAVIALLHPGSFLLLLNCFYIQIPQWRQC